MKKIFKKREFDATQKLSEVEEIFFEHYRNENTGRIERGPMHWEPCFTIICIIIYIVMLVLA